MALLPPIKRFLSEDFRDEASWIGKLFLPLNLFLNAVYAALNNGLTHAQNMTDQVKTVTISGSTPQASWQWPFSVKPIGLVVIAAVDSNNTPILTPGAAWSYSSGTISIQNMSGLTAGITYQITFLVTAG